MMSYLNHSQATGEPLKILCGATWLRTGGSRWLTAKSLNMFCIPVPGYVKGSSLIQSSSYDCESKHISFCLAEMLNLLLSIIIKCILAKVHAIRI
jgi:hypothetical protein